MNATNESDIALGGKWQIGAKALLALYAKVDAAGLGTTKVQLAKELNVSRPTLDRYLHARPHLERIAKVLVREEEEKETPGSRTATG